jgi:hypothetical protein
MPLSAVSSSWKGRVGLAAIVVLATTSRLAEAGKPPDRAACARAYEQSQRLRQAHELKAAHDELLICSAAECPSWVRRDCVPWLGQVEAAMPSITIVVRNADGSVVRNGLRISVDHVPLGERAVAEPVTLDPGEHVVVLESSEASRVEQRITLREGERARRVDLTLTPLPDRRTPRRPDPPEPQATPPSEKPEKPEKPAKPEESERPTPALVYVLGVAGIAVGAAGGYFQVSGMLKRSALDVCAPRCSSEEVEDARQSLWAGNVLIGLSVASLAAAAWLYLSRPTTTRGTSTVRVDAVAGVNGVFGVIAGDL